MFYVALDGDSIGAKVGRAVIANDVDELHKVSARIDAAQDFILHWCKQVDGIKISGGGDEATMAIPQKALSKLESLRKSVEKSFGYTISVGVGKTLSEAGTSLLVAKLRGKDCIVYFNKKIKEDIKKAKRRVREKRASQEEYKLAEAYLEKSENMACNLHKMEHKKHIHGLHKHEEGSHDSATAESDSCPYCADDEADRTDNCAYCQDLDAVENADGTAGMDDCPACKEYDADQQETGGIDLDNCPYCDDESMVQANPNMSEDQTNLAVEDMGAERPDDCPECQKMYGDAVEEQPDQSGQSDPNLQGHETAEEVLDLLDAEPGSSPTPEEAAMKIDNTELPQGDQMKENTSVPENFGDAQKNDISDSELGEEQSDQPGDEPDMAGVLQSGLDDHANEQKRAQVIDQVSQTLQGFKANKAFLEEAKDQSPGLYQSTIQMLKAMIELCKLLGLEPQMPEQQTMETASASPQDRQIPSKAAPSEGAAQNPKTQAG